MEILLQDIRYGLRTLIKARAYTFVVIIVMALGIGANSAVFSVVNAVLLRPLAYEDAGRLIKLSEKTPKVDQISVALPDFLDWRNRSQVFEQIAAYKTQSYNLTGMDEPVVVSGAIVSSSIFSVLKINPFLGQAFRPEDDQPGGSLIAAISYGLWQDHFGSDMSIIGKQVILNDKSYTIRAVLPANLEFPPSTQLWVPIDQSADKMMDRKSHPGIWVIGRLKSGSTIAQARAEMRTIAGQLEQEYPETNSGIGANAIPIYEDIVGDIRSTLIILQLAVILVLLIACANIANLSLARSSGRQKEIAIRVALGANRSRLIRQLLTESIMLAIVSGGLGLLLAYWGLLLLRNMSSSGIPRLETSSVDFPVFAFTLTVSVLTGVIFGLIPAMQASRPNLQESLKDAGKPLAGLHRNHFRKVLVASEIALTLTLLITAALMVKSFLNLQRVNPGFAPENVLTMKITLSKHQNSGDNQALNFYQQLLEGIRNRSEVESAALTTGLPFVGAAEEIFAVEDEGGGAPDRPYMAVYQAVSSDYFRTMSIPITRGRDFDVRDVQGYPEVVIIDETIARRFFKGIDPIGKRIKIGGPAKSPLPWRSIIGVAGEVKHYGLDSQLKPGLYMPYLQIPPEISKSVTANMILVARSPSKAESLGGVLKDVVLGIDPNQPVSSVRTMREIISDSIAPRVFLTFLLVVFAGLAITLAVVGLYGVIAYSTLQRTHEFGIRMALGARPGNIIKLVLTEGAVLSLVGIVIGLIGAFASTRIVSKLLFGVSTTDTIVFVVSPILIVAVALLASYVPARRAAKIDPNTVLRYE